MKERQDEQNIAYSIGLGALLTLCVVAGLFYVCARVIYDSWLGAL